MAKQFTLRMPEVRQPFYLPEAASQSFKAGDMVYLVSGAVTILDAVTTSPYGFAGADATGTTGTILPVFPILAGDVYEGYFVGTLAVTDFGVSTNPTACTAGVDQTIADGSTSANIVNIVGIVDPVGTVNGRVLFQFCVAPFSVAV